MEAELQRPRVALRESCEDAFEQATPCVYDRTLGDTRLFCGLRLRVAPVRTGDDAFDDAVRVSIDAVRDALSPLLREALEEGLEAARDPRGWVPEVSNERPRRGRGDPSPRNIHVAAAAESLPEATLSVELSL